jgi:hypothetical protein
MIQGLDPDAKDPKVRVRAAMRMVVGLAVLIALYGFLHQVIGM